MRKSTSIMLALIVLSILISVWVYPDMPEIVPSHWNARGEVDGHMPKFWALSLMPIVSIFLLLLFIAIPRIDPLKKNIEKFRGSYEGLVVVIIVFLFYINLLIILASLEFGFNMTQMMAPALGILFLYMGSIMGRLKRNWFIGIKTPWTLSSDRVWEKTHRVGGRVFQICGIIAIFSILAGEHAIWFMLVPILVGVAYVFVYSYLEYQKEGKK